MPKIGGTILRNPELRKIRGLMFLEYKLKNNASDNEVGKAFGVSDQTVTNTISWMKRMGIIVSYEDKILQELMPLAHEALKDALKSDAPPTEKAKIALEIYKGMLPAFAKNKMAGPTASSGNELAAYIDQLRGELGIIDGEIASGGDVKALPPATESEIVERVDGILGGDSNESLPAQSAKKMGSSVSENADKDA